jgi:hypothetical protein
MQLEIGKRYKNRQGVITAPLVSNDNFDGYGDTHHFYDPESELSYKYDGSYGVIDEEDDSDLIEEYIAPATLSQCKAAIKSTQILDIVHDALEGKRGEHQQLIAEVGAAWITTLLQKNNDYGSSVFKEPVLCSGLPTTSAIDVRMSDKIARIQNLKTAKQEVVSESIQDTYNDLGSYCLLRAVAVKLESK